MSLPQISIICNTYNHEKYIAQALDSFLMQKIDVPFEVLVHDDASTDGTADIIREYQEKYPDIIKPIFQSENQYTKNGLITYRFQIPRARGKYLAYCEGDDYWTDPDKLRIQYEFMEKHNEYSACCHGYDMVDVFGNVLEHCYSDDHDSEFSLSSFLYNQLKVPQLATFFVKKEIFNEHPGVYLGLRMNDTVLRIYCAVKGPIYFFKRNMSAYRRFVEGSWTMRIGIDPIKMANELEKYIPFFNRLNKETDYKYNNDIELAIDTRRYQAAWLKHDYKTARKCKSYKNEKILKRLFILFACICPRLAEKIRK